MNEQVGVVVPLVPFQQILDEQGFIVVACDLEVEFRHALLTKGKMYSGEGNDFPQGVMMITVGEATKEQFEAQHLKLWGFPPRWDLYAYRGFLKMAIE